MKKLTVSNSVPSDPIPQEYRRQADVVESKPVMSELPNKRLYGIDLKNLSSFRKLRSDFKKNELRNVFIHDVKLILDNLDPLGEDKFSVDLLVAVMNLAEQFFIYPKARDERNNLKIDCVKELMLPFFGNNEEFLVVAMLSNAHKVKLSRVWNRVWSRVKLYFR